MAKWQKNALGKLLKTVSGKVVRALQCCCGQVPPHCEVIPNAACGPAATAIYDTYKATISGVSFCAGVTGDLPNRDFYVHQGVMLTLDTVTQSATDYQQQITFAPANYFGDQQYIDVTQGGVLGPLLFSISSLFLDANAETDNFCGAITGPKNNDLVSGDCGGPNGGHSGTITFTPCPDCAVDCDGSPCATVTLTGSHPFDPNGEYVYQGKGQWSKSKNSTITGLTAGMGPAGCYWAWTWTIPDDSPDEDYRGDILSLYVWYDGKHWRGLITRWSGGGFEEYQFVSTTGGTVACTDGVLTGSLELAGGAGTVAVDLNDCVECHEVTANFDNNNDAEFNSGENFPPGEYEIEYLYGAITYASGVQGYRVHAIATAYYYAIVSNGSIVDEAPPQGVYTEEASEADVTTANAGATVQFTHGGGPIGIRLIDDGTGDNALDPPENRAPRFKLCPVPA